MSKAVEIINALVSPANKLIDAVTGAIGKAYQPRHIRKVAEAKVHEINAIGQALRDNADVPIVYDKGELSLNTTDFDEFVKRTQSRLAYQELQKQQNIENVADKAYELLENETECSSEPISQDWMTRFFNSVEDISNEDMQTLWARILAGEIKQPNTYSLRTLEVLRNLTPYEANVFQHVCSAVISYNGECFLPNNRNLLRKNSIIHNAILSLQDCGLLMLGTNSVYGVEVNIEGEIFLNNEHLALIIRRKNNRKSMRLKCYPLTRAGIDLASIISAKYSDAFILSLAEYLKEEHKDTVVEVEEISNVDENYIWTTGENLLEKERTQNDQL